MKAPISWLKEYVDINCSIDELVSKLFSCGFEVEEVIEYGKNIDKIVTCKILSIEKHPNADKLSVTQIDAGKYGTLQIITAATNIFVGAIVPVALDGATLFNGDKIYNGKLRGLPSNGMFCSGEELGINDDFYDGASVNGILILKEDYPLGEEVADLLNIRDTILDINVTANRPDCQSILGLAREAAAVLNTSLKLPDTTYDVKDGLYTTKIANVKNEAFDLCPRYQSHLIENVKIAQSPAWLKRRLFSVGIRSINSIVDITNYVLTEIGQPMHAFDLNDVDGNSIVIRRAKDGEKITTLDNKEFALCNDNLVICDCEKPIALAGVMGGLNSEIKDDTKTVLFEAATFKRDNIRKTSRKLAQRSDSSARYEKGVDLWSVDFGMKRALNLVCKLGVGDIAEDGYDLLREVPQEKTIKTTISRVNSVLGLNISSAEIKNILQRLNFGVNINGDELSVTVPLYREDMESYQDIAEEIIREYGYDHITSTLLKTAQITTGGLNADQTRINDVKNLFVAQGFNEMISYSFVSEKEYDLFGLDKTSDEYRYIKILNPISEDMAVMRTSLAPSVIRAACYNINRKNNFGRLFELAKVYNPENFPNETLPVERNVLAFAIFGENEDYFTTKGVVETFVERFCHGVDAKYLPCKRGYMHPTRSADIILDGNVAGYFGQISYELSSKLDIDKPIYVGEIFYDAIKDCFNDKIVFETVSKYPVIERDIAVSIDESATCASVIEIIKQFGGEFLRDVTLFDVYKGNQVASDKKSMAFSLTFVSKDRTLNVGEIDDAVQNIVLQLKERLGAELR